LFRFIVYNHYHNIKWVIKTTPLYTKSSQTSSSHAIKKQSIIKKVELNLMKMGVQFYTKKNDVIIDNELFEHKNIKFT
jgi:ethanolamine utilization protein EutQ (cupin superfamily)